jgi:hypothetical protein
MRSKSARLRAIHGVQAAVNSEFLQGDLVNPVNRPRIELRPVVCFLAGQSHILITPY